MQVKNPIQDVHITPAVDQSICVLRPWLERGGFPNSLFNSAVNVNAGGVDWQTPESMLTDNGINSTLVMPGNTISDWLELKMPLGKLLPWGGVSTVMLGITRFSATPAALRNYDLEVWSQGVKISNPFTRPVTHWGVTSSTDFIVISFISPITSEQWNSPDFKILFKVENETIGYVVGFGEIAQLVAFTS